MNFIYVLFESILIVSGRRGILGVLQSTPDVNVKKRTKTLKKTQIAGGLEWQRMLSNS